MIRERGEPRQPGALLPRTIQPDERELAVAKEEKEETTKERTRGGTRCQSLSKSVRLLLDDVGTRELRLFFFLRMKGCSSSSFSSFTGDGNSG